MARGDMKVDTLAYTSEVEILNRKENEAVSMTVDYTGYIHTTRAQANSGLTYDAALVTALNSAGCRIAFEEPIITSNYSTGTT